MKATSTLAVSIATGLLAVWPGVVVRAGKVERECCEAFGGAYTNFEVVEDDGMVYWHYVCQIDDDKFNALEFWSARCGQETLTLSESGTKRPKTQPPTLRPTGRPAFRTQSPTLRPTGRPKRSKSTTKAPTF